MKRLPRGSSRALGVSKRFRRQEDRLAAACEALEGRLFLSDGSGAVAQKPLLLAQSFSRPVDFSLDIGQHPRRSATSDGNPPALLDSIPGIDYDTNAAVSGMETIPANPSAAAGADHLVTVVNGSIEWFTKTGTLQYSQSLATFFASLSAADLHDGRVMYDPNDGRFMVVGTDNTQSTSRILLAVTDTSDPNGMWQFTEIEASVNVEGVECSTNNPTIATDSQAVYISGDLYGYSDYSSQGSRLWIIDKNTLYYSLVPNVTEYDPGSESGLGAVGSLIPAQMFGTGTIGTFLVSAGWSDETGVDYLSVIRVENALTTPVFTNAYIELGDIDFDSLPPNAAQYGGSDLIATGDNRITNAVWRDGSLFAANTVNPPSGEDAWQATAHWYQIDTEAVGGPTLSDQGDIGGEEIAPQTATFYPAIAVDQSGNIGVGFSASGPSLYAGAYLTGRNVGDPAGTVLPSTAMHEGEDYYYRTMGGGENAWGNFSSISLDPADDATFWVYNQYAMQRGSASGMEDGRWATELGSFQLAMGGATGDIRGSVFYDLNQDQKRSPGEWGLSGWQVYLDENANDWFDSVSMDFSSSVPVSIPDQTTVASTIDVSGMTGTISDLRVSLDISHTWVGDLAAYLVAPSGDRILLFERLGGSGDNFSGTVFDDDAAVSIVDGLAPFRGEYQPMDPLSTLYGLDANGQWQLEIMDLKSGDSGVLNGWYMQVATSEPVAWTDAGGMFEFAGLAPGDYEVGHVTPGGWTPTSPAGGFWTAQVAAGEITSQVDFADYQAPASISGSVYDDLNGDGSRDAGEEGLAGWRVYLDADQSGTFDAATMSFTAQDTPLPVSDQSTLYSSITIPDMPGMIRDVVVTLNLTHSYDADVSAYLISPAGVRIKLFSGVGGSGDDFTQTIFDDAAAVSISDGAAPFTGSYRPAEALASFQGQSANGTWYLEVSDADIGDEGTLVDWSLWIDSAEPSQVTDAEGAYAFSNLPPGTYDVRQVREGEWVQTEPVGGFYSAIVAGDDALGAVDFGNHLLSGIKGTVFDDTNGNGQLDGTEPGLSGWEVFIDENNNGARDVAGSRQIDCTAVPRSLLDSGITDSTIQLSGFTGPITGLKVLLNIEHTYDSDLDVYLISSVGTSVLLFSKVGKNGDNFEDTVLWDGASTAIGDGAAPFTGNYRPAEPLSTLNGESANGTWTLRVVDTGAGDQGNLIGWSLIVDASVSEPSTITDAQGRYQFTGLDPGTYTVREIPQAGWVQTSPPGGAHTFTLQAGDIAQNEDFGNRLPFGELSGTVFNDTNGNGVRDAGEGVLAGWRVFIDADANGKWDAGETSVLSGADGAYSFTGLPAGTYVIGQVPQDGWVQTAPTSSQGLAGTGTNGAAAGYEPPFGAAAEDNSEFMLGDVYVTVVLMESDGSIDANTEDWTSTQISQVKSEVQEGLTWWEDTLKAQLPTPLQSLKFYPDFTYANTPVSTGYEPITRTSDDQSLWMPDFLKAVGYNSPSFMDGLTQFNNAQRTAHEAQWAFTIFVVNSKTDTDGEFTDGEFAYAFLGGPMAVMTYDNDGWGIGSMGQVTAHEVGHIFYALDEYSGAGSYTETSGYYDTQNLNAADGNPSPGSRVPSIMSDPSSQDAAYAAHRSSSSSLQMIGWRDGDHDGVFDVLDVPLTLTGSGHYNAAAGTFDFTGDSAVATLPNENPWGNANDITINTVDHLQYRLDGGAWTNFSAYGGYSATISVSIPVPPTGAHQIELRTIDDDTQVSSAAWSAAFSGMLGLHVVTLGIGEVKPGLDFGDRQTAGSAVQGTAGNDQYYLALNEGGTAVLVYPGASAGTFPIHSFPIASGPTLTINLGDGADAITLGTGLGGLGLLKVISGNGAKTMTVNAGASTIDLGSAPGMELTIRHDARVDFPASQTLLSLTLEDSAVATLLADGSRVLRTNGLTITGDAALDLADNDLILQSDVDHRDEMLTRLTGYVGTARNAATRWQGPGIRSGAAENDTDRLTGLSVLLNKAGLYQYFDEQPVNESCIIVKYTWNGDMDLNEKVNTLDYARIDQGFLSQGSGDPLRGCQNGDLDYNGKINTLDYALIDSAFLGQRPALPKLAAMSAVSAPRKSAPAATPAKRAPAVARKSHRHPRRQRALR